ncbi:hypothetical protein glysoja_047276 [Glycine soja]|uniref:Uncharacterized protein n=1 Tax=Glycine soja TaxID=3848 RepID=A0A0B2R4T9_GLYSO|nr:hypothetical protein glysoja_047276 [Glycine soja]
MVVSRVVVFLGLILATLVSLACSQSAAPAPAPTSDGMGTGQDGNKYVVPS